MKLKTTIILFLIVQFAVGQNRVQRFDSIMTAYYSAGKFNGNVLIAEKGKVIYSASFGLANETTKEKLNDNSVSLVQIHEDLNKTPVYFGAQFHSDTNEIILISSDELSYIFDSQDLNADWEEFYNDYENSNGIIRFSRIAFNEDKTQAIFEIGHSYASLGGGGSIIYLKKQNDTWTIMEVIPTWIS